MAFRLGHQISCNTNKNFFFRNSSATARRYNRSLSRGTEKPENLVENAHHHETETTTTTNNNYSPSGPLFWGNDSHTISSSTDKPWRSRIQARDYNTELERKIARQTQNLRSVFRRTGSNNYALQPKNLPPMATTHIHVSNKFTTLEEIPNRPYGIRLDELQRQAYVKYEKAVRTLGLKRATENPTYRYQLEAAKMSKRSDIYDIVAEIKNREQTKVALAPQLQPKNIKPYGDIIPVSWSTQGIERLKQKPLSISRLGEVIKRGGSNPNTQVRHFSSMQTTNNKFRSGSLSMSDNSKSIEDSKEFAEPSPPKNETETNLADEFDYDYSNAKQPKLQLPGGFSDGKVVLYYSTKGGKGVICSKVQPTHGSKEEIPKGSVNQFKSLAESKMDLTKYRRAVITRAGPKVTLQSRELDDSETSESINPGSYEKFTVPWMSWGERVKMKMQERIEEKMRSETAEEEPPPVASYPKQKSSSMLERKTANLHVREFSTYSDTQKSPKWRYVGSDVDVDEDVSFSLPNHEDFLEGVDWPDFGPTSKTDSKVLNHTSTRLYTTRCHRGVLEPEGTVMVKLPRLPKVHIEEPNRNCPPPPCCVTCRADANLKVVRKNLPALKVKPCTKTCTEPCMLEGEPLARPKRRPIAEKVIVEPCLRDICPERADRNLKILPKKLPKLVPKPCGRCEDIEMTSPPLLRLKPRSDPPEPPRCKIVGPCGEDPPTRADANLKIVRKKLPSLVPAHCPRICPPEMMGGPPLMRPKAINAPLMTRPCIPEPYVDPCPPRADHLSGYRVVKRQLPTVLLAEKNNEMTIQEYATAQLEKQKRSFSSYSKCDMCCFSNRKLQPDLKVIQSEISPKQWEEFRGLLKADDDGKLEVYDTVTETVDTSTGTELLITRKPIGGLKKRDGDISQRLLKGGYSVSYAAPETRKYCISAAALRPHRDFDEPPLPNPDKFTLPKLRRLEKRCGFDVDFPADSVPWKQKNEDCMIQYIKDHPEPPPRMDNVLQYEVTSKTLPVIPRGTCRKLPVRPPRDQEVLVPPRKLYEPVQEREACKPIRVCFERADDTLVEIPKKLPPPPMSSCIPVKPEPYRELRKLPRLRFEDADPPRICPVPPKCPLTPRADEGIDLAPRKVLPTLKAANCPRAKGVKMAALRPLKRLPPHPFMERIPCIPEPLCCDEPRADKDLQVLPKVLPPLLKNDKRLNLFNPVPCPLNTKRRWFSTYRTRRFCNISHRFLSTTPTSHAKDCKLKKDPDQKKKCYKTTVVPCKPIPPTKSMLCPQEITYPPCTKQKSPYPSFSECKDDDPYLGITECAKNEKHLQPKYPIVGEFLILKPPPPEHGQIDVQLEEECILKKLNIKVGGTTKTCDNFHKPDQPLRAKQLMKEALKQTGVITEDIRCELLEEQRKPMTCDKKDEKLPKPKGEPGTVICQGPPRAEKPKIKIAPCRPYQPKISPPKKTICEKKVVECPDPCEEEPKKKSDGTKGGKGGKGGAGGMGGGQIRSVGSSGSSNPTIGTSTLSAAAGQKPYCKFTNVCRKNASGDGDNDPCSQFGDKKKESKDPCGESKGKKGGASADPCGGQSKGKKAAPSADPCGGQSKAKKAAPSADPCGGQTKAKKAAPVADPCAGHYKAKKTASQDPCGSEPKAKEESQGPCGGATKDAGDPCQGKSADSGKPKAEAKKSGVKCSDKLKQAEKIKPITADAKSIAIKCAQKKKAAKAAKPKSPLAIKCRPVKKPPPPKPKMKCLPKAPPVVPRQRSLWDRIVDFFRARPGCPAPDQWKKDKLKRDAERAAAAAGYELCEKKKPKKACTFPPPAKGGKAGGKAGKCGMKVKSCVKAKPSGGATCKPKAAPSKCAQKSKQPPCPPRKVAAKAGSSRCMSSHRRTLKMPTGAQVPTVESLMPKGVDPRQKYPSSVELPYANFPESTENFPKMPMSESMFGKIKPEMEPKQSRPYSTCRWDPLNHNAMYGALGQKLTFSTSAHQFGLCGPFSYKHLSIDGMNANVIENDDADLKRTTVGSADNQGISDMLALPVTSSALYSCPVPRVCKASILSNCVLGMSTNSISQYLEKAGLFQRRDSELNVQQRRDYSSSKDCKIKPALEEKKCKTFPQQPCCPEKQRVICESTDMYPPCTPIEAPYPSFSECYQKFKRLPVVECNEQFKRHTKQKYSGETDVTTIQAKAKKNRNRRNYSTMSCQRYFSSCPKNGNSYPMLLPELSEETLRDMEEKELAKKVLHTVKSGMEAIAICGSDVEAQEAYYQLYEELEKLCENDLNKTMNVCEDLELQPICSRDLFPDTLLTGNSLPMYADDSLHQLMTIDAIKSFCFSIPTMSTTLYEESEQYKTEKLQKQLDELLDYYKAQKI